MPESDVVTMTHPDLPDRPVTATRRQFEAVWKDRGWRDADATEPDATPDGNADGKAEPLTDRAEPADEAPLPAADDVSQPVPPTTRTRK